MHLFSHCLLYCLPSREQVHGRAVRKVYEAKLRDLTSLRVARFLYKELTGDESEESNIAASERQAAVEARFALVETFVLTCGEAEIVADLRGISNASRSGKSVFNEFWGCVTEELDAMILAADDRRHGGLVAYLSEVISHSRLYARVQNRFKSKVAAGEISSEAKVPSEKWFAFQFWPSNEHVQASMQHRPLSFEVATSGQEPPQRARSRLLLREAEEASASLDP